jgi:SAM-dependent methyltransferase
MKVFASRMVRIEAIDDLSVTRSFDKITQMPQYGLALHLFTSKALLGQRGGNGIDVGCGGGRLVIKLAKSHPFFEVIGLDLSNKMLKLTKERVVSAGLSDRVKFSKKNAERIPYPDETLGANPRSSEVGSNGSLNTSSRILVHAEDFNCPAETHPGSGGETPRICRAVNHPMEHREL